MASSSVGTQQLRHSFVLSKPFGIRLRATDVGVTVMHCEPGSLAQAKGVAPGMVLLSVAGRVFAGQDSRNRFTFLLSLLKQSRGKTELVFEQSDYVQFSSVQGQPLPVLAPANGLGTPEATPGPANGFGALDRLHREPKPVQQLTTQLSAAQLAAPTHAPPTDTPALYDVLEQPGTTSPDASAVYEVLERPAHGVTVAVDGVQPYAARITGQATYDDSV